MLDLVKITLDMNVPKRQWTFTFMPGVVLTRLCTGFKLGRISEYVVNIQPSTNLVSSHKIFEEAALPRWRESVMRSHGWWHGLRGLMCCFTFSIIPRLIRVMFEAFQEVKRDRLTGPYLTWDYTVLRSAGCVWRLAPTAGSVETFDRHWEPCPLKRIRLQLVWVHHTSIICTWVKVTSRMQLEMPAARWVDGYIGDFQATV